MSQRTARKSASIDDKEKNQTDSAVKDLKKKMAATAEKDKQATEKPAEKKDITDKKQNGDQPNGDSDKKAAVKNGDKKPDKAEKSGDKTKVAEKKNEEEKKDTLNGKGDNKKADAKQNGHTNGANGSTVSDASDEDCMVIDEEELFPELTYDDTSDTESPTAEMLRSVTRRSQVKQSRTPETPRPASDKQTDEEKQSQSKETKLLKLKEDLTTVTNERRLRSTDSPKKTTEKPQETPKKTLEKVPESPKKVPEKVQEQPKKDTEKVQEQPKKGTEKVPEVNKTDEKVQDGKKKDDNENTDKMAEVVILVEDCENNQEGDSRKPDTNFSKSRVKVSPYRRSGRIADLTASSVMANYTGNNTTMETDISECSFASPSQSDDRYIAGLRSVRGRSSYRPGAEIAVAEIVRKSAARKQVLGTADPPTRPTGTVVGRKRKPDYSEDHPEPIPAAVKRPRALDSLLSPFRRVASSTPLPVRRAQPIVGINSDLPMAAPIAATSTLNPESIKPSESILPASTDSKRCVVM